MCNDPPKPDDDRARAIRKLILDVVRGNVRWNELIPIGILDKGLAGRRSEYPEPVAVTPEEVIAGFRKLRGKPEDLEDWASFMLGTDLITFERMFESPAGESVHAALYDACFGETATVDDILRGSGA